MARAIGQWPGQLNRYAPCDKLGASMRVYKHLNPGRLDAHPGQSTRARISNSSDVHNWLIRTGQNLGHDNLVTATFIVDTGGWLWIADRHSEHVACAAGCDVLSAGEIPFYVGAQVV